MANVCLNRLIAENIFPCAVILPDKSVSGRELIATMAQNNKIPIFEYQNSPNEPEFIEKVKSLNADLGVMCSFNHKLSEEFLKTTQDGFINCHPSKLPEYRGGNPYYHVILNNETESAVTLHFADTKFDTGNIIAQEVFPINKRETMGMLFSRTNFMIADMLANVLKKYLTEGKIDSFPQPAGVFKKAPNVPNEQYINWSDDVTCIDRLVRAANPFFNVLTGFRGAYIKIISGEYHPKKHDKPFGEIIEAKGGKLKIAAGGGFYYPKVIQPGSWGIYDTEEFIQKFNVKKGEILR